MENNGLVRSLTSEVDEELLLIRSVAMTIQYGDAFLGAADMRTGARHSSARERGT